MLSHEIILRFNPNNPEKDPERIRVSEVYDKTETLRYIDTNPDFYRITDDRQIIEIAKENFKLRSENENLKKANLALLETKNHFDGREMALKRLMYVSRTDSMTAFNIARDWFTTKYGEMTEEEKKWLNLKY